MGGMLAAYLAEVGLITFRSLRGGSSTATVAGLPVPAEYLAATILYGALGLATQRSGPGPAHVATAVGWAFVLATALNLWDPATGKPGRTPAKTPAKTTTPAPQTPGG